MCYTMVNIKEMNFNARRKTNQIVWSSLLISLGVCLLLGAYSVLNYIIQVSLTIQENSPLFHLWKENPIPLHVHIYVFNWTNPEDIYKSHVKPKFEQIGPFVFREEREKRNVTFHANDTVSFRQHHTFFFQRNLSVSDMRDEINSINIVLATMAYFADTQNLGYLPKKGLQMSISQFNQTLVQRKAINEFLFDGYDDVFVSLTRFVPWLKIPSFNKFAWLYKHNATSWEGDFNMGTAYHNFGVLKSWNYADKTSAYEGTCGNLSGTSAGELYLPYRTKDRIECFLADLCRSIPLDFEEEVEVGGIAGYKYSVGTSFLDNGTFIPENKCYCFGECFPSGTVNIAGCQYGAPGFISLPHFYRADEFYTHAVEGLFPQKEKNEFFITLEPYTGIPLQVAARLQLNVLLQPVKYLNTFDHVPRVVVPVFWAEETATLPPHLITILKLILYIPTFLQLVGVLITAIGLFFAIESIRGYVSKYQRVVESTDPQ